MYLYHDSWYSPKWEILQSLVPGDIFIIPWYHCLPASKCLSCWGLLYYTQLWDTNDIHFCQYNFALIILKRQKTSTKPGKDLPGLMVLCLLFEFKARLRVHLHMARFHEEKEDIVKTKLNLSIITRIKLR